MVIAGNERERLEAAVAVIDHSRQWLWEESREKKEVEGRRRRGIFECRAAWDRAKNEGSGERREAAGTCTRIDNIMTHTKKGAVRNVFWV